MIEVLTKAIRDYVVLNEDQALAVALWSIHTHSIDAFEHAPRLQIKSPVKGCGKTTLLNVVGKLVHRPADTENISMSALFRALAAWQPTMLLDEADSFLQTQNNASANEDNNDMRGILNAGHKRGGAVIRCVGDDHRPTSFPMFGPVAFAWLVRYGRHAADTLVDRSITIELRKRLPTEKIERFRSARTDKLDELARKIARWRPEQGA